MRAVTTLSACLLLLTSHTAAQGLNRVINPLKALMYLPFENVFELDAALVTAELNGEGFAVEIYKNAFYEYDVNPEECTLETFLSRLQGSPYGMWVIDTHGIVGPGDIAVEAYGDYLGFYLRWQELTYVKYDGTSNPYQISWGTTTDGAYVINVSPNFTAETQNRTGYQRSVVVSSACGVLARLDDGWPGSACRLGVAGTVSYSGELSTLVGMMAGGCGQVVCSPDLGPAGLSRVS